METNSDTTALLNSVESDVINTLIATQENSESNSTHSIRKVFSAGIYSLVQMLIGGCVCVTLWFAFKSTPVNSFDLHIGLSVIGYQLLTVHGLLTLQGNGWSALSLRSRRRVHWVFQLMGSATAITGSVVIIIEKSDHFTTWHGKFALAALIFNGASLINGLTSLYSAELRYLISVKISKISHILFGVATFVLSSVSLAFGYNKKSFKKWASEELSYAMIAALAFCTVVIIAVPCYNVLRKMFHNIQGNV